MSPQPETFDEYYARVFAYRVQELARCADAAKRSELEAIHRQTKEQMRGWWDKVQAVRSTITEEEWADRRAEYRQENAEAVERSDFQELSSYRVINGAAS
jgi:hypothetical protein